MEQTDDMNGRVLGDFQNQKTGMTGRKMSHFLRQKQHGWCISALAGGWGVVKRYKTVNMYIYVYKYACVGVVKRYKTVNMYIYVYKYACVGVVKRYKTVNMYIHMYKYARVCVHVDIQV